MKLRRSEVRRLQRQTDHKPPNRGSRSAPSRPPPQDYFNEAINVPDFFSPLYQCKIWTSVAIASPEQSDREDTSNGWNKQRHMIEIKDAFVGFKPSPLPPHPTGTTTGCLHNPRPFVPSQRPNSRGFNAD